ncbi:MAG: hypothetical protein F2754_15620 [Actinobacteria bacterium]|uniref:Unannotated protein n=1 Tax=freshwater metagenome TaxID=449393 RepID=A0A6J7MLK6_9ZZZZ|nr:hypothetical protein [Actinomycetota bacterium]MSW92107.1 hypothetical protein [Actinomycetota bacterium]MSX88810.1 hypothetical protein [Actinomycetota bacterium]
MSDHARLEAAGIPTVTFVLDAFEAAARAHLRIHGADLPIIIVPRTFLEEPSDDVVFARDRVMLDAALAAITR